MPRGHAKLTESQRSHVVAKAAAGWSLQRIVAWLEAKEGVKITPQSVHRIVQSKRTESNDATLAEAGDGAAALALAVGELREDIRDARALCRRAKVAAERNVPGGYDRYVKASANLQKWIELVHRIFGGTDDAPKEFARDLFSLLEPARGAHEASERAFVERARRASDDGGGEGGAPSAPVH